MVRASLLNILFISDGLWHVEGQRNVERNFEATLADAAIIAERGLPNAPNGYAPENVTCPSTRPTVRQAAQLSQNEQDWLRTRRQNTLQPMKDLLSRLNIQGLDTNNYIDSHSSNIANIPNIGIAASGGGWRALLNGAGALAAFDSRTTNSTGAGQLGGLLQSSTYLAGLSGGSWLVGSMFMNNFSTISNLLFSDATTSASGFLWGFQDSIIDGPPTTSTLSTITKTVDYFSTIYNQVSDKGDQGFNTTLTDYWGRALAYQLINATDGGPAYTWSSTAQQSFFTDGNAPLPLIVADGRYPGETIISLNATNYEFNPWEMGSWDPTIYGFVPMEYVGSAFENGQLPSSAQCVRGFDSASYVMGTSSSLFNQIILNLNSANVSSVVKGALESILTRIGRNEEDIADWAPNPFFGWNKASNVHANDRSLTLVDGGEDLQNIPFTPLIQPVRNVDVIFAIDSSADTTATNGANWPNGTSLVASYERSLNSIANGTSFPAVPAQNSFVNLGLNNKPTFFGCNSSNTSSPTPLIVYLPNAPYVYHSNISTFQLSTSKAQQYAIVRNGYDVVTQGNATRDKNWPTCVGCAILQRSLQRTNTNIPKVCQDCFSQYCWDGTVKNQEPSSPYMPAYILKDGIINGTSAANGRFVPNQYAIGAAAFFSYLLL